MKRTDELDGLFAIFLKRREKLRKLIALQQQVLTLEAQLMFSKRTAPAELHAIAETVCTHYDLPVRMIAFKCKEERVALPRQIVFCLCRLLTGFSYHQIGRAFKKDHGTVMCGVKSVKNRIVTSKAFAAEFAQLEGKARARLKSLAVNKVNPVNQPL